jgi:hypothetical protein
LVAEGENFKLKGRAAMEGGQESRDQGCEYAGGRESMEECQLVLCLSDRGFREPQASSASKYVLRQRRQSLQKCEQFAIHFF